MLILCESRAIVTRYMALTWVFDVIDLKSENRKVGGSTPPLATSLRRVQYPPYTPNVSEFDRISRDPAVMAGKPCIRGTRVTVGALVGLVAAGKSTQEILTAYPYITAEDISQALSYAAWRSEEVEISLPA